MQDSDPSRDSALPSGLVFFRPEATPAHRRRRQLFVALYLVASSAVLWPIYPWFATAEPRILGLPLSFAWVIGALLAAFAVLVWFYLGDEDQRTAEPVSTTDPNTGSSEGTA